MKLCFQGIDEVDCSRLLVEAVIHDYSAIQFASELESDISFFAEKIDQLRCLKANTDDVFCNGPEALGYERYDDNRYLESMEELFYFEGEGLDDNHLNDQDYIEIANAKYPNEYDRCIILKSNFVLRQFFTEGRGKDFSYWNEFYRFSYKVVVRKSFSIDETKEYSLDELSSFVKSRDVLIITGYSQKTNVAIAYRNAVESIEIKSELEPSQWLDRVKEYYNPFHSCYMAYLKQHITEELVHSCTSACICACRKVMEYPEDKCIRNMLRWDMYSEAEVFEGMNANQRLRLVKQYEKSYDLMNKAREIIVNYSDEYKTFFK